DQEGSVFGTVGSIVDGNSPRADSSEGVTSQSLLMGNHKMEILTLKMDAPVVDVAAIFGVSIASQEDIKPIMLDSFTSSMCTESWGRSSFAHCLIEVKVDAVLKDSTMGIPLPDGLGFSKEMV
ncbi:hypothetical protein Tco_1325160, partial [Tanacetum coccineum]